MVHFNINVTVLRMIEMTINMIVMSSFFIRVSTPFCCCGILELDDRATTRPRRGE
ncbi:hypothetical protein J6TS7_66530 [Paenibacillus dendritiformis]|nr:hypothetical protein J6TS7_66530 [Paenibacillus dendritiformis]